MSIGLMEDWLVRREQDNVWKMMIGWIEVSWDEERAHVAINKCMHIDNCVDWKNNKCFYVTSSLTIQLSWHGIRAGSLICLPIGGQQRERWRECRSKRKESRETRILREISKLVPVEVTIRFLRAYEAEARVGGDKLAKGCNRRCHSKVLKQRGIVHVAKYRVWTIK